MTILAPDEEEIDTSPSAPLLQPVTASIMPDRPSLSNIPVATASIATPTTSVEAARVPSFVTTPLANGTGNIERTTNPNDGSLSVKVTTITSQPNGYREILIEYFHIPTDMTSTVSMLIDEGTPPLSVYRTNMERQIVPPSSAEVVTSSPPQPAYAISPTTATTTTNNNDDDAINPQRQPSSERTAKEKLACTMCSVIMCSVIVAVPIIVLVVIFAGEQTTYNNGPAPPPYPVSSCNGKRTGGTPNWTDATGDSCEWYEGSSEYWDRCSDDYTGAMGPANDHCCYCLLKGVPTPRPTYYWQKRTPFPVSSCNGEKTGGTPGWKDRHGSGCDYYEKHPWYCKDVNHPNGNAISSPMDHCCACMIESAPPSASPVQSTPTVAPTLKPNQVSISLE